VAKINGTPRDISVEGVNIDDYLVGVITDEKILSYNIQTLSQSEHKGTTQALDE